jgi:hypothetical protein
MAAPVNNDYLKFLESVEDALYCDDDFEHDDMNDSHCADSGLVYTFYNGANHRRYSAPMFEIKQDHRPEGENCYRCNWETWRMHHDEVQRVAHIVGFEGEMRVYKPVHYNRVFAARRSHP